MKLGKLLNLNGHIANETRQFTSHPVYLHPDSLIEKLKVIVTWMHS